MPINYMESEFANYHDFPESFRATLPYLIASVVYHYTWLLDNLPARHPVRSCAGFIGGNFEEWRDQVICGRGTSADSDVVATGIPPTLIISQEIDKLASRVAQLENIVGLSKDDILQFVEELLTRLPAQLEERLTNRFAINGVLPVTRNDLERHDENILNRVSVMFDERLAHALNNVIGVARNDIEPMHEENGENDENENGQFERWMYGGNFHAVPQGFRLLSINCKTLYDFWNFGDRSRRIRPFRRFKQGDLSDKYDQKRLIKARKIMTEIESRAVVEGLWPCDQSIRSLGAASANRIYQSGYDKLLTTIEEGKHRRQMQFKEFRRDSEIQFTTLYNDLKYIQE